MNDIDNKLIIYQVFTRLFGNNNNHCIHGGSLAENGCGKMADFTGKALGEIKRLGATHVWYTGIIEHATQTDYRRYNIRPDHPAVVKGKAGSPYAIKDYYDVDPDLAKDVPGRMKEFENLVQRTHRPESHHRLCAQPRGTPIPLRRPARRHFTAWCQRRSTLCL